MIRFVRGIRPFNMAGAIARRAPTPPASPFACVENTNHAEGKNVSQDNSGDGEGYPQANSGGAAGPEAPASPSGTAGAQPQNKPDLRAPENGTQQVSTEALASPSTPTGAQPQSNPALREPENATQQA